MQPGKDAECMVFGIATPETPYHDDTTSTSPKPQLPASPPADDGRLLLQVLPSPHPREGPQLALNPNSFFNCGSPSPKVSFHLKWEEYHDTETRAREMTHCQRRR
jgi:hypothetical protein